MPVSCPRCGSTNPDLAHFCRNCGLAIQTGPTGPLGAGQVSHPTPLAAPPGFNPVVGAADLCFTWQAAGGGPPLLGTETLELQLFNGGYDLAEVLLLVQGQDRSGRELLSSQRQIDQWPRGQTIRLEIPSYELAGPVHTLTVKLVKAEFADAT